MRHVRRLCADVVSILVIRSFGSGEASLGGEQMIAASAHAPSRTGSVLKPALLLMCGRTLAFAATFFIPVVLVRFFDPTQFGTYKQLMLIYSTAYLIAQAGMASSLYYFL